MNPVAGAAVYAFKHAIMRFISVVCVGLVIGGIGWALWTAFIKPHTSARMATSTTNQSANKIVNQYLTVEEDNCWIKFLGVKAICFKDKTVYKIIKEEGEVKLEKKK